MSRKRYYRIVTGGALCLFTASGQFALAQDEGGLLLTYGIEQRLEAGRNLELSTPEEGAGTISSTILSFGLSSETHIQRIDFNATTALRLSDLAGRGSEADVGDTRLQFAYEREAANAVLGVDAEYSSLDIGFLDALSDFRDDDGVIDLPSDFDDLTGRGTRRAYELGTSLELGRQDMVGFILSAEVSGIDYSDTTDPDLSPNQTWELGGEVILRFSPTTTGRVELSTEDYSEDGGDETERTTNELAFGLAHDISPRTRIDTYLGYSEIDEFDLIDGDTSTSGIIGGIGLEYDMPNGVWTADLDVSRDTSGRLQTFSIGRSLDIPDGVLAGTIGISRDPQDDTHLIGSLNWIQELGANDISARISRSITTSSDDESRVTTIADVNYIWGLTPLSSISFGAAYAVTGETPTAGRIERTDISAIYNRSLTRDWSLNAGAIYRIRDEQGVGRSESPLFLVSVGRDFAWRP
ncbi:hypothetical protein [Roseovarius sp. Pro17]|uniref:hypothetical protein n=1 Tax=Roseovarius sp. Pro17 TaxID=3108175 RepID=UPI002D7787EA|nr:hypothetical protein [Roseovarius sp. Pro17]